MPVDRRLGLVAGISAAVAIATLSAGGAADARRYGLGRAATAGEIAGWNIDAAPDGTGLPAGHGSVAEGEVIFKQRCAACHGERGAGKPMNRLVGGVGTMHDKKPVRTVGSYWPYATTLFDYVHRAMPFDAPQSLKPDEVYAATAYVLFLNGIVSKDGVLDASSLPKIEMPNRKAFKSAWPEPAAP